MQHRQNWGECIPFLHKQIAKLDLKAEALGLQGSDAEVLAQLHACLRRIVYLLISVTTQPSVIFRHLTLPWGHLGNCRKCRQRWAYCQHQSLTHKKKLTTRSIFESCCLGFWSNEGFLGLFSGASRYNIESSYRRRLFATGPVLPCLEFGSGLNCVANVSVTCLLQTGAFRSWSSTACRVWEETATLG